MSTQHWEGQVTAGPGGAMTDEVGVITGDLTVRTTLFETEDQVRIEVQYIDADEWYTLTGSPVPVPTGGPHAVHTAVLAAIQAGGGAQASDTTPS